MSSRVYPPQGLASGSYSVAVSDGTSTSNALPVTITAASEPVVEGPAQVPVGSGFTLFATPGAARPGAAMLLSASTVQAPSVLPNVVTLAIGNQFQALVLWPGAVTPDPATGVVAFPVPALASLTGTTLYFQAAVLDPTGASPLPTTNVSTVSL